MPRDTFDRDLGLAYLARLREERDAPPSWDVPATFASYGWTSPTTLVISVRELDATRRTFVRMSVDGRYALCELWAEGMLGGMEPMRYTMAAEV